METAKNVAMLVFYVIMIAVGIGLLLLQRKSWRAEKRLQENMAEMERQTKLMAAEFNEKRGRVNAVLSIAERINQDRLN